MTPEQQLAEVDKVLEPLLQRLKKDHVFADRIFAIGYLLGLKCDPNDILAPHPDALTGINPEEIDY